MSGAVAARVAGRAVLTPVVPSLAASVASLCPHTFLLGVLLCSPPPQAFTSWASGDTSGNASITTHALHATCVTNFSPGRATSFLREPCSGENTLEPLGGQMGFCGFWGFVCFPQNENIFAFF